MELLDGKTTGPKQSGGPIGEAILESIHNFPITKFAPVPTTLQSMDRKVEKDLSGDQALLRGYMLGIAAGQIDPQFVKKVPGPVFHARWLTKALRILILYTREPEPSSNLCMIVKFIQEVYGPFWFRIKSEPDFTAGPSIIFDMTKAIQAFPPAVQQKALAAVARSSFCLYSENFLACLLFSMRREHRAKAAQVIVNIRRDPSFQKDKIRVPRIPCYSTECFDWGDMIDLDSVPLYEPPCVSHLDDQSIMDMVDNRKSPPNFPLHSQSVERAVKLTSEVTKMAVSLEKRNQLALGKTESRKLRPKR